MTAKKVWILTCPETNSSDKAVITGKHNLEIPWKVPLSEQPILHQMAEKSWKLSVVSSTNLLYKLYIVLFSEDYGFKKIAVSKKNLEVNTWHHNTIVSYA